MRGKHTFVVSNQFIKYEFTIKRNITIIQGDSATGKSALLNMLEAYSVDRESSGVEVVSDVPVCVYRSGGNVDWKIVLQSNENSVVFIDEDFDFITTKEFAAYVEKSASYYVIITREDLENLPYSVEEIYRIRESGKYGTTSMVYNVFENVYVMEEQLGKKEAADIRCVITEDSKAGFQFWRAMCDSNNKECISASGKSNVVKCLRDTNQESVMVIADGAAFGSQMRRLSKAIEQQAEESIVFLPESFEWLLLKSDLIPNISGLQDILEHTYEYVDCQKYMSWERFFTALLVRESEGKPYQYTKNNLNQYFTGEKAIQKVKTEFPILDKI